MRSSHLARTSARTLARTSVAAFLLCAGAHALATCNVDEGGCGGGYSETYHDTPIPTLALTSTATQNSLGSWDYVYTLARTGSESAVHLYLSDLVIPYFDDAGVSDLRTTAPDGGRDIGIGSSALIGGRPAIRSTSGYSYEWIEDMVAVPEQIRFTSSFAPGAASVAMATFGGVVLFGGDGYGGSFHEEWRPIPAGPMSFQITLPASPFAVAAAVPEPSQMALLLTGLAFMVPAMAARRRTRADGR